MDDRNDLDYRDGQLDRPERNRVIARFIGGMLLSIVFVGICGMVWSLSNVHFTVSNPHPAFLTNAFNWIEPLIATAIAIAILALLALLLHRYGGRGIVAGMLAGFVVMMLIEGICFYSSLR